MQSREFGPREGFKSHHITRHIWSGGCTIIHNFDTIPRTDTTASSQIYAFKAFTLLAFLRTEIGGNQRRAEQKSLACPSRACGLQFSQSFLLQNTPYALFFLPSSLALRHFGFFLAWSVGLRRAPEFRARETGEVGYALEGIHGSVKVRWDLRIHASLS